MTNYDNVPVCVHWGVNTVNTWSSPTFGVTVKPRTKADVGKLRCSATPAPYSNA